MVVVGKPTTPGSPRGGEPCFCVVGSGRVFKTGRRSKDTVRFVCRDSKELVGDTRVIKGVASRGVLQLLRAIRKFNGLMRDVKISIRASGPGRRVRFVFRVCKGGSLCKNKAGLQYDLAKSKVRQHVCLSSCA